MRKAGCRDLKWYISRDKSRLTANQLEVIRIMERGVELKERDSWAGVDYLDSLENSAIEVGSYLHENLVFGALSFVYRFEIVEMFIYDHPEEYVPKSKITFKTYLMSDGQGNYKMGRSINPKDRHESLMAGNPNLKLIGYINEDIEKQLHEEYAEFAIGREWFKFDEKQIKAVIRKHQFKFWDY